VKRNFAYKQYSNNPPYPLLFTCTFVWISSLRVALSPTFIDTADQVLSDLVFVFDDYHLVEDPAIHDAVAFLLEHLPHKVHFIISSRSKPPLPLARYRTRRQLFELEVEDLQFTREETVELLNQLASINLTLEEISSLHNQTEGWIAGLHLAALHLRRGHQLLQNVPLVSGRHRFISDYLAQEVLNQLPVEMQDFLLKTSILDDLCGPLCEAVVERAGGQAMLEALERENLFIIPLDDQRQWYRYHSLFREFLQAELFQRLPGEINRLHNQAAHWYLAYDLPEPAFLHAVAGSNVELVVKIFNDFANAKLLAGELRVVEGWFKALPEAWLSSYPVLNLMLAGFLGLYR
jgi:LuxR family transcriptional regulator, maltose regulon positive regulatory protein